MSWRFTIPRDPRILQIAFLGTFLVAGILALGFELPPWQPPLILSTACFTQWGLTKLLRVPAAGYRSAIISSLGLSLLLRSDAIWVPVLAAFLAIASKFLIRIADKHVFNPTNFGLAAAMLLTPHAWCSPSQWGEGSATIAWLGMLGLSVAHRAFRSDVSLAFLGSWIALKAARVLYLGQKLPVLLHQLTVGSLILFTFFMISDPKTTPDSKKGRVLWAALVAALAFYLQHGLWKYNALIWALLILSPAVPLIDRLFHASRYQWPAERTQPCTPVPVSQP